VTAKLWRVSPRVSQHASLAEQFTNDTTGNDAGNEVAADKFFGDEYSNAVANSVGAFSISGTSSVSFSSQALIGPPPGVLPCNWFHDDSAVRVILAEFDYVDQVGSGTSAVPTVLTKYLSDQAYIDDENNRSYEECITEMPRYSRSVDRQTLRGKFSSSIGTLELNNADGSFDDFLKLACDGSEVRFYIGDITWPRSQFMFVFSATPTKITAPSWDKLVVTLKDNSLFFNKTIGGATTVGGTGTNADSNRPWNFGYVRQVQCILQDFATLTYVHSDSSVGTGAVVLAVRDKGIAVSFVDNGDGTLRLLASPAGVVTCDVLVQSGLPLFGDDYNVSSVTGATPATFGSYRFSDLLYEVVGVTAGFNSMGKYLGSTSTSRHWFNDFHCGISLPKSQSIEEILTTIFDSMNAFWAIRRDGYWYYATLRPEVMYLLDTTGLVSFGPETFSVSAQIDESDIVNLSIDHADPGDYDAQGYANANWSEQSDFATSLTADQQNLYTRAGVYAPSWRGSDPVDTTAYLNQTGVLNGDWYGGAPQLYHKSMTTVKDVKTIISCANDLDAQTYLAGWEALRRSVHLPWVEFIDVTLDLCYLQLELGDAVQFVNCTRFGLNNTVWQVLKVDIALSEGQVNLGLVRRRKAVETY
jgi:hypothetical protein